MENKTKVGEIEIMENDNNRLLDSLPCHFPKRLPRHITDKWYLALMNASQTAYWVRLYMSSAFERYFDSEFVCNKMVETFTKDPETACQSLSDQEVVAFCDTVEYIAEGNTQESQQSLRLLRLRISQIADDTIRTNLIREFDKITTQYSDNSDLEV